MTHRPLPAGPHDPLEGPQLQTTVSLRYALALGDQDPYRLADDAFVPILVTNGRGAKNGPHEGQALEIDGAVVSAVERRGDALHVRVFNPDPEPAIVSIPGRRGWTLDLAERPRAPFEGRLELGGNRIATLLIRE
jgi:hypothetical protein